MPSRQPSIILVLNLLDLSRACQGRSALGIGLRCAYCPSLGYRVEPNRQIERAIAAHQVLYARTLDGFLRHRNALSAIPYDSFADDLCSPHWSNLFFSGLDAASLVCFILEIRPEVYFEIDSGNSTTLRHFSLRSYPISQPEFWAYSRYPFAP